MKYIFIFFALTGAVLSEEAPSALKGQYKKHHRPIMAMLGRGEFEDAVKALRRLSKHDPDDAETQYCLAMAYSGMGDGGKALGFAREAVAAGLSVERLVAGPRSLNGALLEADGFMDLAGADSVRLVHGPLLGDLRPNSVKVWLRAGRECECEFKVICSSVPMTPGVKPGSRDTWDGYEAEREGVFQFVAEEGIEGVFVRAADRHRSDAWKNERPDGAYPIYEFMSSKLTNIHTHPIIKGCIFGYNARPSFGEVVFEFSKADPTATYNVYSLTLAPTEF